MPYADMPWVRGGCIRSGEGGPIRIDSAEWFVWVEGVSSFCYSAQGSWIRLTVRKEKRGAHRYWYGYSRIDAKLHNVYLGKSERLTQERLERACERIRQRARERRTSATNPGRTT